MCGAALGGWPGSRGRLGCGGRGGGGRDCTGAAGAPPAFGFSLCPGPGLPGGGLPTGPGAAAGGIPPRWGSGRRRRRPQFRFPAGPGMGERWSGMELRGYQREAVGPALRGRNSIVWLPTGAGKTRAAVHVCRQHLESRPGRRVAVLVNKVPPRTPSPAPVVTGCRSPAVPQVGGPGLELSSGGGVCGRRCTWWSNTPRRSFTCCRRTSG